MTTTPKDLADKLRQGLMPLLKGTIGDLEAHYRDLRERELRKAEACQKCGDMHKPLEKCGEMAAGKPEVKKEEPKMNPAPLKDRKTVPDQKAAPDAAHDESVLPNDKKSKDLTDKKTGSGGQLEKIRKAAMSETKKAEKLAKPGAHTEKEKRQAAHIKESYESKGRSPKEAESLAWATVNKSEKDSFDWGAAVPEPLHKAKSDVRSVPMETLHGQRVHVYRNLHNGLFSLWKDGKVIAHVPEVHLDDVKLHVREGGRQRVIKEKKKNVHAFVIGTVNAQAHADAGEPVIYNPYMHAPEDKGSFVRAADQSKVGGAAHVHMRIVDDAKGLGGKRALMNAVGVKALGEKPMAKAAMSVSMAKPPSGKSPTAAPKAAPAKAPTAAPASSSTTKAPAMKAPAMKAEKKLAKAADPEMIGFKEHAALSPEKQKAYIKLPGVGAFTARSSVASQAPGPSGMPVGANPNVQQPVKMDLAAGQDVGLRQDSAYGTKEWHSSEARAGLGNAPGTVLKAKVLDVGPQHATIQDESGAQHKFVPSDKGWSHMIVTKDAQPHAGPLSLIPGVAKGEEKMEKAGPRLGGKDPMSQGMTNDAAKAAKALQIPGRKASAAMTPEDHARRAAEMAAFTPASVAGEARNQGAAGGALKPSHGLAPSGLELARQPKPKTMGVKSMIPGRGK